MKMTTILAILIIDLGIKAIFNESALRNKV